MNSKLKKIHAKLFYNSKNYIFSLFYIKNIIFKIADAKNKCRIPPYN